MKKCIILTCLFFCLALNAISQEICDNGIDDDFDGLIDLNDSDCDCYSPGIDAEGIIPNPSFEEKDCCPDGASQMSCVNNWIQASEPTSDYLNDCGWLGPVYLGPVSFPLPGGGEGLTAFLNTYDWKEYIGTCLDAPLVSGNNYTLKMHTACAEGSTNLNLTIYGTPVCADLPWTGVECPVGSGSWQVLAVQTVTYTADGAWQEVEFNITPGMDINAIAIGPDCSAPPVGYYDNYYFLDELSLTNESSVSLGITELGSWCLDNLNLTANSDSPGGTWQWFKYGIAIVGETEATIDIIEYGIGEYSVIYTIDGNCSKLDWIVVEEEAIFANFESDTVCFGLPTVFNNTSEFVETITPSWKWNFGGDGISNDENPSHTFTSPGTYPVKLIALNDLGCNDTILIDVIVNPVPVVNFEINPNSAAVGEEIIFKNLTESADSWNWNFGNGTNSNLFEPTYSYNTEGNYTISLYAQNEYCEANASKQIIISLPLVFYIPNVFTPDGDNFNQTFTPVFTSGFDPYDYQLKIYNRYGETIFESYDATIGWDGSFPIGQVAHDGIYVWAIKFGNVYDDKRYTYTGHVVLLK